MSRKAVRLERSAWARDDEIWRGRFEGKDIGADVTVLFFSSDEIGAGPVLHVHPYDEVFIVRTGRARPDVVSVQSDNTNFPTLSAAKKFLVVGVRHNPPRGDQPPSVGLNLWRPSA